MSRAYYQNHKAKRLEVNFNQKQWRQDFADFVKNRLSWVSDTVVTRAKTITKGVNLYHKGIKYFEIQNSYGDDDIELTQEEMDFGKAIMGKQV